MSDSNPESPLRVEIVEADLDRPAHQDAIRLLTNAYAQDPMGSGAPLAPETLDRLIPGLRAHPTTSILLAFDAAQPVGIATCFRGFSTFAARPLLNLHDLAVLPDRRAGGIGRALLAAVEAKARSLGCCKVTLEVQENNRRARSVYAAAGFAQGVYEEAAGGSLFYTKNL
jgi:GNAT superfamily N-acetyltransferase